MCGICGIFGRDRTVNVNVEVLAGMNQQLRHRGPDDEGYYVKNNVGLAMRRLSIIDIETGQQPVSNEDKSVWIVFNGEIYNYRELRRDLEASGHRFRSQGDTEAIVHLYEEYGASCVDRLRGMFAFVVWDERRRVLFAARDRLGIKPFYYVNSAGHFLFASEIKSLLKYPGIKASLNSAALREYLALGYISGPETLFAGVKKLLPGHTIETDEHGRFEHRQYWDLAMPSFSAVESDKAWVDGYSDLLEDSVKCHLVSDVPVGVFLSGGLDSSAIAALATKISGARIQTFSVGYEEVRFSELQYAQAVSEHLGSDHHEISISANHFLSALPQILWHEDEPVAWPSSIPLYFVARLAGERVKVVLTGEGSDETLGGYGRYASTLINYRIRPYYKRVPKSAQAWLRSLIRSGRLGVDLSRKLTHTIIGRQADTWSDLYLENYLSTFSPADQLSLLNPALANGNRNPYDNVEMYWQSAGGDDLQRLLYTDIKTYLVELLMKQDQMSMAASVESRVPFLDHPLVEFAARLPSSLKVKGRSGKMLLKTAMKQLLPQNIIHRRKMGFPTPWRSWLRGKFLDRVDDVISSGRAAGRNVLRMDAVNRIVAEHRSGAVDHGDRLWTLLNLEIWHRIFIDGESASDVAESALPARSNMSA